MGNGRSRPVMANVHGKEIGLPRGRILRYEGDASKGLRIGLPNGETLTLSPAQIAETFAALSGWNPLLLEPPKARETSAQALRSWSLSSSGRAVLGRSLDEDTAIHVAFAFMGEGLLRMELGAHGPNPKGFPLRRKMDCLLELEGRQGIYLEGRVIAHVSVATASVQSSEPQAGRYELKLRRLATPGFPGGVPETFEMSGVFGEGSIISIGVCTMTLSYIGSQLITCPGQVREIVEFASRLPRFKELYRRIRAVPGGDYA